jgi:photosystem II stability/assembly factor-like uncharacterized protein
MRQLITLLTLILAVSAYSAEFATIRIPTKATINQIYFHNDQLGWAVTSDGEVLNTFDGGKNWRMTEVTSRNIHDIHFRNRTGYIVGDRGLLMKSTNGGATWQDMSLNIKYNLVAVGVVDDSSAITCGTDQNSMSKSKGELFETRDHGRNWKKHNWRLGNGFTDLAVYPPRKVYLLAVKKFFHSINNGLRYFHGKYEGSRMGFGCDFIDNWGFMVGHEGFFARSADHGRTWVEIPLEASDNIYAVEMFDRYSGVAVGEDGLVMYIYNDGDSLDLGNCGQKTDLHSLFITGEKIFIGGDDGLLMYKAGPPQAPKTDN